MPWTVYTPPSTDPTGGKVVDCSTQWTLRMFVLQIIYSICSVDTTMIIVCGSFFFTYYRLMFYAAQVMAIICEDSQNSPQMYSTGSGTATQFLTVYSTSCICRIYPYRCTRRVHTWYVLYINRKCTQQDTGPHPLRSKFADHRSL